MFGKNPKRPPEQSDGSLLKVQSIFLTLQGEGPFAGHPSVFLRLGGCNLACHFCDTEFESFKDMKLADIRQELHKLALNTQGHRSKNLIVITGGEPLRQNIIPLCQILIDDGFTVQIETNGTLYQDLPDAVHVICSPKNTGAGYGPLRPDMLARAQALKFIVSQHDALYHDVPNVGQAGSTLPVYVQPMDVQDTIKNQENMAYAAKLAQEQGYILSLQTHKILGIE